MICLSGLQLLSFLAFYKSHGVSLAFSSILSSFATLKIQKPTKYSLTTTTTLIHQHLPKMSVFNLPHLLDLFGEPVKDRRAQVHEDDPCDEYLPSQLWNAKIFRIFMLSDKDPSEVHFLERATCTDGTFIWVFTEPKRYLPTSSDGRINLTGACIYTPNAEEIFDRIKEHYSKESNGYTELKSVPGGMRAWHKKGRVG